MESFSLDKVKDGFQTILVGQDLDKENFILVFSSYYLLQNAVLQASNSNIRYICVDTTYKITVLGYPLLIVGTQDIEHKFRPIGMAIAKHEREQDYVFLLRSLRDSLRTLLYYEWKIDLVMSDASDAIHNACATVFGDSLKHAMCSVHVFRNVEKKISSFVPTTTVNTFDCAIKLFEEKWEAKIPEFLQYFFREWIDSRFNLWYRGSIPPGYSHIRVAEIEFSRVFGYAR